MISHCAISVWSALFINCDWRDELFFTFRENTNKDIPSSTVEIHIQIHAQLLDSLLGIQIIIIAKINNKHHNHTIHHHRGCWFLLFIQNIISIIHLIKAHNAKTQIIIVHTRWDFEKISQSQINANIKPPIQSNQTKSLSLFLNALMIADIPPVNKKNHNITSTMFQNKLGEQIVIIQKIIINIESHNINRDGHSNLTSESVIQFNLYKIKPTKSY